VKFYLRSFSFNRFFDDRLFDFLGFICELMVFGKLTAQLEAGVCRVKPFHAQNIRLSELFDTL